MIEVSSDQEWGLGDKRGAEQLNNQSLIPLSSPPLPVIQVLPVLFSR